LTVLEPYGGAEGRGFGSGEGRVSGAAFSGRVRWANRPHRRSDGVLVTRATGLILTEDQIPLLFSLQGRMVFSQTEPGGARPHLLTADFEAEDERFRWLNQALCVAEGTIHPDTLRLHLRIYVCRSEARGHECAPSA
jgi:hypothetical protein